MPMPLNAIGRPLQPTSLSAAKNPENPGVGRKEELENACRDFESLFVHYMLKQMRETVPDDGLFGGGQAEKMYTSMMDTEVAKEISRQRGLGLAPMMYRQMMAAIQDDPIKK